jgi:hypothetical protein
MLAVIFIGLSFLLTLLSFHINMYIRDYTTEDDQGSERTNQEEWLDECVNAT